MIVRWRLCIGSRCIGGISNFDSNDHMPNKDWNSLTDSMKKTFIKQHIKEFVDENIELKVDDYGIEEN